MGSDIDAFWPPSLLPPCHRAALSLKLRRSSMWSSWGRAEESGSWVQSRATTSTMVRLGRGAGPNATPPSIVTFKRPKRIEGAWRGLWRGSDCPLRFPCPSFARRRGDCPGTWCFRKSGCQESTLRLCTTPLPRLVPARPVEDRTKPLAASRLAQIA